MSFQTTLFLDSSSASGVSSNFTVYFKPPIELGVAKTYELALISANIRYSLYNITAKNNQFRYRPDGSVWVNLAVPPGTYNIVDINAEIKRLVKAKGHDQDNISITPNYNTLKS